MTAKLTGRGGWLRLETEFATKENENIYLLDDGRVVPESHLAPKLTYIDSMAIRITTEGPNNNPCRSLDDIVNIKKDGTSVVLGQVYGFAVYYSNSITGKDSKITVSVFNIETGQVLKVFILNHSDALLTDTINSYGYKMCLTPDGLTLVTVISPRDSYAKFYFIRFTYNPITNTITNDSKVSLNTSDPYSLIMTFSEDRTFCFIKDSATYFKVNTVTGSKTVMSNFSLTISEPVFCESGKVILLGNSNAAVWDVATQASTTPVNAELARITNTMKFSEMIYIGIESTGLNRLVSIKFSEDFSAVTVLPLNSKSLPLSKFYVYRESSKNSIYIGNSAWLLKIITDINGEPSSAVETTVNYKRMTHNGDDRDIDIELPMSVYNVAKNDLVGSELSGLLLTGISQIESSSVQCLGKTVAPSVPGKIDVDASYNSSISTLPSATPISILQSAADGHGANKNNLTGFMVSTGGFRTFVIFGFGSVKLLCSGKAGCSASIDVTTHLMSSRVATLSCSPTASSVNYAQSVDVTIPVAGFAVVSVKCVSGSCYVEQLLVDRLKGFLL